MAGALPYALNRAAMTTGMTRGGTWLCLKL
jgi:hypothetical protein